MASGLRKVNGRMERRGADGVWRPLDADAQEKVEATVAAQGAGLESELAALTAHTQAGAAEAANPVEGSVPDNSVDAVQMQNDTKNGSAAVPTQETRDTLDIGEVPGLLSDESPKSTSGAARLQKLRARARGKVSGSRVTTRIKGPREVLVPSTAAEVSGPDADGSRPRNGQVRRSTPAKEAPALLEGRPQWVKDLFEAHFRSELAYVLRRLPSGKDGKNRMKLSRQDYAIGWLVCFDKAREDQGILRAQRPG